MRTSTWKRDYEINITDNAINSITASGTDITNKIFANNIISSLATSLVHEMTQRQISIRNNERNLDGLSMEEAYLLETIKNIRANI